MRCVNVALLQEAVQLGAVIADKSTIGAMKDSYKLEFFSWDVFVNLLKKKFVCFPITITPLKIIINLILLFNKLLIKLFHNLIFVYGNFRNISIFECDINTNYNFGKA